MSRKDFIFTSESVSEGHPDKVCDLLSDSLLDEYLRHDAEARCAFECFAVPNHVILAGEVRSGHELSDEEREEIVRAAIRDIGYEQEAFHWQKLKVQSHIHAQSPEIGSAAREGAGDQGIMFGYACRETDMLMPAPIYYAHKVLRRLSEFRRGNKGAGLLPDAKSQISLVYEGGKPKHACSIVVSTQHVAGKKEGEIEEIIRGVIDGALPEGFVAPDCKILVNPGGSFVMGG
ncbi:MAG: S-adenosylmethionine synthetase N-terminal domain-containing protein, partial [Parvibaculales bacterium]